MIRHIVMFELLEEAEGRNRQENREMARERAEAPALIMKWGMINYEGKSIY